MKTRLPWIHICVNALVLLALVALVACGGTKKDTAPKSLLDEVKARGEIIAGVKFDSRPFGFMDKDGKVKGFDIDLMRELAKRILGDPEAVEFQQVLSSTRIIAINSGNLDLVAATMTITPARQEIIDFSDVYFTAGQGVIVHQNSPIQKLEDLHNKKILFIMGTTSESNIKKRLPWARYIGFKTSTDAFAALKAGRGDAMTTDDTILAGFMPENCQFRLLPVRLSKEPYGLGFKKDPYTQSFRLLVNEKLAEMKKDGTLDAIGKKWLGTNPKGNGCAPGKP